MGRKTYPEARELPITAGEWNCAIAPAGPRRAKKQPHKRRADLSKQSVGDACGHVPARRIDRTQHLRIDIDISFAYMFQQHQSHPSDSACHLAACSHSPVRLPGRWQIPLFTCIRVHREGLRMEPALSEVSSLKIDAALADRSSWGARGALRRGDKMLR